MILTKQNHVNAPSVFHSNIQEPNLKIQCTCHIHMSNPNLNFTFTFIKRADHIHNTCHITCLASVALEFIRNHSLNAQEDELPIDEAFAQMRLAMRGEAATRYMVKDT